MLQIELEKSKFTNQVLVSKPKNKCELNGKILNNVISHET